MIDNEPVNPTSPYTSFSHLKSLGCSLDAFDLTRDADVIDLHIDTFIPHRLWGYDPLTRNRSLFGGHFFGHLDLPRIEEAFLNGAMWSITTNPFRTIGGRWATFEKNVRGLRELVALSGGRLALVTSLGEYQRARADGRHAVMLSIQGGNALEGAPANTVFESEGALIRVTLVHLTQASFGASSSPFQMWSGPRGLNETGKDLIRRLNEQRIFLDLAHAHPETFWSALEAHNHQQPFLVTHTGVKGVRDHWRNLDDDQIRAVVQSGGVVGVMAHKGFLSRKKGPADGAMVVEHMEHVLAIGGKGSVAFGSDFDGAISPPQDLCKGLYPMLTEHMLRRGWSEAQIRGALGGNFLAVLGRLRP